MNDYQEYRSYGSYLSRIFGLIIGFLLLILAIWFVVRLADNSNDDSTLGDAGDSTLVEGVETDDDTTDTSGDGPTVDVDQSDESEDGNNEADENEETNGEVSSINTDDDRFAGVSSPHSNADIDGSELPSTGAETWIILVIPAVVFATTKVAIREN